MDIFFIAHIIVPLFYNKTIPKQNMKDGEWGGGGFIREAVLGRRTQPMKTCRDGENCRTFN